MYFQHASRIWADHPDLVAGVVAARAVDVGQLAGAPVDDLVAAALARLDAGPESELPEIRAWRRTFTRMGLKPTQYRCASESLLRRLRKERELPRIHPLIDLCNAVSVAFAVPVAAFDTELIDEGLEVRYANGEETYLTFAGETEHPANGEVIFADAAGRAHARRWTNRQSGYSAVGEATTSVLIVAEAMHESAASDIPKLLATLAHELPGSRSALLSTSEPRWEFQP